MQNCKIFLVRHTQTVGNVEKRLTGRTDYEITPKGQKYIKALTDTLANTKFDNIYCSTSKRTYKTIEPLAKLNKKEIIELEDLCEMDFGIYDGWKWDDVNKINPQIHKIHLETNEIKNIPNQESTETVANRMYNCIYKLSKENLGKTILICSHGVAIEAFLRKILNKSFLEDKQLYCQHNATINELYLANNQFKLIDITNIEVDNM